MNKFIPVCEPYLNGNEKDYVLEALQSGWISSSGKYIKLFEEKFAEYCGAKYAVCVINGTMALHLALVSLGVGKGDEVIIPDFTMIASAFAVCYTGAKPVFVDADKKTWNINADLIEEKITEKTKAIMPVSIFGNPCDYDKINRIAQKYNLLIIEDAAESVGAEFKGIKTGALADITAFSFFANKNLTTGEGGMITTNSEEFYNKARYYKNLCFPLDGNRNYIHNDVGYNYRMSNIHAAIGLAQVEKADYYKELRIKNGNLYKKYLSEIEGVVLQETTRDSLNVYWMNGLSIEEDKYGRTRDELINHLNNNKIDTRLFFVGMSKQPSLRKYGCDCLGGYPVTENLSKNGFYLPSASSLTEDKIKYICDIIKGYKK
ncbi:MAG TPA: DegT/DnrJ/EryC1/StrS family aminotransferase [Spirochaetota bacterium]|nr:DegT/DnrJ/EryC1/StrS family aminotransferase [Spirochaetota bacterium]HOS31649.1 DegT/DnrJ/EryC1/StrS family aminotransferase [Spirochaetota bacterium]HOS54899.1 DegT/DnrJ/EryC1/StrS family aminotransferase [Spirochaetota bacterium]HPK62065.1 DegT/DnrJ/EryC1/StrS family aminotransferase [Spirochaetota bacterium]HQF77241.1 DegT/DnrJ/EryC1/StrS family aminotransferase [Spirochaetota bacterium]